MCEIFKKTNQNARNGLLFSMFSIITLYVGRKIFFTWSMGLKELVVWISFICYFEWTNSSMCYGRLFTDRVLAHYTCAFCLKMPSPESEVPTKSKNNQTQVSSLDIHDMYLCMYDIYDMYVFLLWGIYDHGMCIYMEYGIEASLVLINVWQVLFALNINQVSYQIYAYMPISFFFFKNPKPPPIQHFLNVNTHLHFITNDFWIWNIHNWIQLEENNNARFL
jgi:hypothetical protein